MNVILLKFRIPFSWVVVTGLPMGRERKNYSSRSAKVRGSYFELGKIDILKKSGKIEIILHS